MLRPLRHMLMVATAAVVCTPAVLPASNAQAQEATTTRIETRAFYGATVTLEAGVRVFRPLPPHSKVIINPGGVTPIHLSHDEHRAPVNSYGPDRSAGDGYPSRSSGNGSDAGYGGYPGYYGDGFGSKRGFDRSGRLNPDGGGLRQRRPGGPVLRHVQVPVHAKPPGPMHGAGQGGGRR